VEDFTLRPPRGRLARLRRSTLLAAGGLVVLALGGLAYVKAQIPPVSQLLSREQAPPPPPPVALPESLKPVERPYSELLPKPQPPVAQPVPKPPAAPVPVAVPVVAAPPVQAQADPLPGFLELMQKQQALSERVASQPVTTPAPAPSPPQKPARQPWRVKPTDITLKKEGEKGKEGSKDASEQVARQGQAKSLIQPAVWARPAQPWRTIYRSQSLAGRTLDAINSDIPGPLRIVLTVPVFDKFGYEAEILPKGSLIVAEQEGKPEYGQSRLAVKLLQIELPTSEVISLKAMVGDEKGNGVGGKVNNHYGKLLGATAINALISLGGNSLAGTPSSFYANPAQQTARDVSQSVSRDAQKLVEAQLKVPPTITAPAGTLVGIALGENVSFARPALVVR
jgi:type IV secretory pathway VirB10-like protein